MTGFISCVNALAFSPDGHSLFVGDGEYTVRTLNLSASADIDHVCATTGNALPPALWHRYIRNCPTSRYAFGGAERTACPGAHLIGHTHPMEIAEFVDTLDREGRLLASAAEEAGTEAKVVTCPGWQVRDLLRHTGMVHRWAGAFVAEGYTSYQPDGGLPDLDGGELLAWFREGHRWLVDTLFAASPDVECWSFLPAPSPLAFWARRQAHETTVHRVDAESALGQAPTAVAADFAVDGIEELLCGFHVRGKSRVRSEVARVLRVRATDQDALWTVRLSSEPVVTEQGELGEADCELSGPAAELYLSLWNRRAFPSVCGDASLAALWREKSQVTWN